MTTSNELVPPLPNPGFAVWLTGLPASGKTAIAHRLLALLRNECGLAVAHLESDRLRTILTPEPSYNREERDQFYATLVSLAHWLSSQGIAVVIDATANRRKPRGEARELIAKFLEVYVQCPLEICISRDPKGIYRKGVAGEASMVPGMQDHYEEPESPDVLIHSDQCAPEDAAQQILRMLRTKGWL